MNNFSFTDFLYRKAYGKLSNDRGKAEVEVMENAIGKRSPFQFDNGFSLRALTAQGADSEGGYTVDDNVVDNSIFDNFYQASYFLSNATILDDLKSNISVTSKSTPISFSGGVTETATAANALTTEPAFSKILLKPKHIRVSLDVSVTLLEQTSVGIDRLILNDLKGALSEELDRQIFKGDSTSNSNEISGIIYTTGIATATWGTLSGLTGPISHGALVDAEGDLGTAKVPQPYHYIVNSNTRKRLRDLKKTGFNFPIFSDSSKILGYDTFISENLDDADCFVLNPQYVVIGMWHPLDLFDLIVDGHTKFNSGIVTLTASLMADSALLKPKALSVISES